MSKEIIELEYPVSVGGLTVKTLELRRPKVRDIRKMEKAKGSDSDRSVALIVDLAEVAPDVIDELDPVDMAKINAWLEPILSPKDRGSDSSGR